MSFYGFSSEPPKYLVGLDHRSGQSHYCFTFSLSWKRYTLECFESVCYLTLGMLQLFTCELTASIKYKVKIFTRCDYEESIRFSFRLINVLAASQQLISKVSRCQFVCIHSHYIKGVKSIYTIALCSPIQLG